MLRRKLLTIFLAALTAFSISAGTTLSSRSAVDFDSKIKDLEKRVEEIQRENQEREQRIDSLQGDIYQQDLLMSLVQEEIDGVVEKINAQADIINEHQGLIDAKRAEITALEGEIENTEREIELKKVKIEVLEAENEENLLRFGQIVRNSYINADIDDISILMGATSFFDLLVRTEMMENVGEKNAEFMTELLNSIDEQEKMIVELETEEAELISDKETCEGEKVELETALTELESKKSELEADRDAELTKLNGYASEKDDLKSQVSHITNQFNVSQEEIDELNAAVAELIREKQRQAAASQKVYSSDSFIWPLENNYKMITSYFGYDPWRGGQHYGIDVGNSGIGGSNIYAVQSGTVIKVVVGDVYGGGYGNYVVVDHGGGISTLYAHMKAWSPTVSEGDEVTQGKVLGLVGTTGWSTGNHLHFEVRVDGTPVNPFNYNYD